MLTDYPPIVSGEIKTVNNKLNVNAAKVNQCFLIKGVIFNLDIFNLWMY
jgi:hypothetical protein